jgi:hypothetical protein
VCGVFELLMQRNGPKRDRKDQKQSDWKAVFDMHFPQRGLDGVFELPLLRNAQRLYKFRGEEAYFYCKSSGLGLCVWHKGGH